MTGIGRFEKYGSVVFRRNERPKPAPNESFDKDPANGYFSSRKRPFNPAKGREDFAKSGGRARGCDFHRGARFSEEVAVSRHSTHLRRVHSALN